MAMQTGLGLSKILILMGAGYTGTVMLKNGKLSDVLAELQAVVKGIEKSGDSANADDPIAAQVRWLAQEVRQLASTRQITVLNGGSSRTDVSSLIVPAAALGAVGYGYMWFKGIAFSDLMYVTKKNMANAVESLTKNLGNVSDALANCKKHLTQRIQALDGKMDEQRDFSKKIMAEVTNTRGDINKVCKELQSLTDTVFSLEDKMGTFEEKQALTLLGVDYLVNFVDGKPGKVPEIACLQEKLKLTGRSRSQLPATTLGLQCLTDLSINSSSGKQIADSDMPGNLLRTVSAKS